MPVLAFWRVPIEAHTEARTACLTSASLRGEPRLHRLYGANTGAERVVFAEIFIDITKTKR